MDVRKIDLNLMQVFDALMHEGNLTRAGFRFGLSQPAMSHALGKLRRLTGDALFVRVPSGMEPTPYALEIARPIRQGLALLSGAIESPAVFDPTTCDRTFNILMSDIGELVYLPSLVTRLSETAEHVNVRVMQLPREAYPEVLAAGEADLAIGFLPGLKAGFLQQRLFDDSYTCLVRAGHPRIKSKLSLTQFCAEAHILTEPGGSRHNSVAQQTSTTTLIERVLADRGLRRRIALRVPHFMVVPEIVRATNLIAVVPSYVKAYMFGMPNLKMLALPIDVPRFEVKQFWHQRQHQNAANRWLRGLIAELFTPL